MIKAGLLFGAETPYFKGLSRIRAGALQQKIAAFASQHDGSISMQCDKQFIPHNILPIWFFSPMLHHSKQN